MKTAIGSSLEPFTSLLKPFTGPTNRVVHLGGLTRSAISLLRKQTWPSIAMCLVFLSSSKSVDLIIRNKFDFNTCAIRHGFHKSSNICIYEWDGQRMSSLSFLMLPHLSCHCLLLLYFLIATDYSWIIPVNVLCIILKLCLGVLYNSQNNVCKHNNL